MRSKFQVEALANRTLAETGPDGCIQFAFELAREQILDEWARSKERDAEMREGLHAELRALDRVFRRLHALAGDATIRNTEQEEERASRQ
jgi:hypothetical protein